MTSNKPYILRALFEWILDNDLTPYLLVNELADGLMVPDGIANDNRIIFNLTPSAIRDLELLNDAVLFSARFNGVSENIFIPMNAILAIYANENGEGMMFPEQLAVDDSLPKEDDSSEKPTVKKPSLTIV